MSNIISRDCGYRLEPWNKCGFLGLHSSWATFSTPNRTLRLLAGEYKQSVGNFLWFLPTWFKIPGMEVPNGTSSSDHHAFLKVITVMAPEKPENCWLPWSCARQPGLPGLWGWANPGRTQTIHHVSRDGSLPVGWRTAQPPQSPHSDQFFYKVLLFCSPSCLMCILTHVILGVYKIICIAWRSPCLSLHHPQFLSIPLHQLLARTLLIFQKRYPLVFAILLCTGKKNCNLFWKRNK